MVLLYKQKKKEYRKNINIAKQNYFTSKISNANNNNKRKETWGIRDPTIYLTISE